MLHVLNLQIVVISLQYEEANKLRDELVEKADMINSLTKSLDASQKQCQELLKSGKNSKQTHAQPKFTCLAVFSWWS